jgi:hypothetical protein
MPLGDQIVEEINMQSYDRGLFQQYNQMLLSAPHS